MRQCPPNPWGADPEGSVIVMDCFVHMAVDISGFICQPQKLFVYISTSVTPAHTDGKMKIVCSEYWIRMLAFLTGLAIFQIE